VFGAATLAVWTRQLAGLVGSRPAAGACADRLADEAEEPRQRELVAHLKSRGQRRQPPLRARWPPRRASSTRSTAAVVAAGEQSGALGLVLERLADDLEERQALRAKLIGAALYPAIVSLVALVIVIFLVTYVVPQVARCSPAPSARCRG
jgi:general secretion pathway protein F